mgnify:CR=1 FL=1
MDTEKACPVMGHKNRHTAAGALSNADWWPNQIDRVS